MKPAACHLKWQQGSRPQGARPLRGPSSQASRGRKEGQENVRGAVIALSCLLPGQLGCFSLSCGKLPVGFQNQFSGFNSQKCCFTPKRPVVIFPIF